MQYDATSEQKWLTEAELSFKASIAMEGKPISPSMVPEQLKEQEWWKKQSATASSEVKKTAPAGQKATGQTAPSSKQPATKQPGKPAQTTRPQPVRAQPAAKQTKTGPTQPAARKPAGTAARQTKQPTGPARPGQPARGGAGGSKPGVATLGELKSGAKKPQAAASSSSTLSKPQESEKTSAAETPKESEKTPAQLQAKAEINKKTYHSRLGLARTLAKTSDAKKQGEAHSFYKEVISMAPEEHDAYIELGEMLAKSDPVGAVDIYGRFPFSDPPSFDDAFLHGEIIRLLMASESYDNSRLCTSLIAMGKALGIGVLEKQVSVLESKFKYGLLKQVYAGVHGKSLDDPDLQAFFKFKCWN